MIAVLADNSTLAHSAPSAVDEKSAPMRLRENAPSTTNALTITVTVGITRNTTTTAKNGSRGRASVSRLRS